MARHYFSNAFSLNMLSSLTSKISVEEITPARARDWLEAPGELIGWLPLGSVDPRVTCAVGHADTAALFSQLLNLEISANRATVSLEKGDAVLVGQYSGPRLPEGATTLPEGATVKWVLVTID